MILVLLVDVMQRIHDQGIALWAVNLASASYKIIVSED